MSRKNSTPGHRIKRALFPARPRVKFMYIIFAIAFVIIAAAGSTYFKKSEPATPAVQYRSGEIAHPLTRFADGRAHHFEYKANGSTIRYFILKSGDGVIRAAFDACEVCWTEDKGYYQDEDFMVCTSCSRRFASARINEEKGGCNPVPLKRIVKEDRLVIKVQDIMEGLRYFDFN